MSTLMGRTAELRAIEDALEGGRVSGRILVIEGEGGIGKSRLVEEAASRADGYAVLWGRCEELEQTLAFAPLRQALKGVVDFGAFSAHECVEAVLSAIESAATRSAVLIVLEDLHWCDLDTVRLLLAMSRMLPYLRVLVVGTLRPSPRNVELDNVMARLQEGELTRLELRPLDEATAVALATDLLEAPPGPRLTEALRGTAGNPLFAGELIGALRASDRLTVVDGRCEIDTARLPSTLRRTVLRHVSSLSDEVLEVLRIASVLGTSFLPAHLGIVTRRSVVDLLSTLGDAIAAGLFEERGDRIGFRHDLIRAAIYEDLPEPLRSALHLEVARALGDAGVPSEIVAEHMALGATADDPHALTWMRETAEELQYRAPQTAVRLLTRAFDLAPEASSEQTALGAALLLPLEFVGRGGEARRVAADLLRRDPGLATEYVVRRALAYSLFSAGDEAAMVEHFRIVTGDAFAAVRTSGAHAADLENLAVALFLSGDLDAARVESAKAALARSSIDGELAVDIGGIVSTWLAHADGRLEEALATSRTLVAHADSDPSGLSGNGWFHLLRGHSLIAADELGEAEQVLTRGLRLVASQSRLAQVVFYQASLARCHIAAGAWDEAEAEAEAARAAADDASSFSGTRAFTILGGLLAFVRLQRGEIERAAETLTEDVDNEFVGFDYGLIAEALLAEAGGDEAGAARAITKAWRHIRRWGCYWEYQTAAPLVVRLSLGCGDRAVAEEATTTCEEAARLAGSSAPSAQATALRCRGLLDADADVLVSAVDAYRAGPRAPEFAAACEDAARQLKLDGRSKEAEALWDEALETHQRLGSHRCAARVASAMREGGVRRGSRGPRARAKWGWESLTPTEIETVKLVAQGLTNREIADRMFKSRYTVESHLRHVFAKLELTSRVELAAEAARRGLDR